MTLGKKRVSGGSLLDPDFVEEDPVSHVGAGGQHYPGVLTLTGEIQRDISPGVVRQLRVIVADHKEFRIRPGSAIGAVGDLYLIRLIDLLTQIDQHPNRDGVVDTNAAILERDRPGGHTREVGGRPRSDIAPPVGHSFHLIGELASGVDRVSAVMTTIRIAAIPGRGVDIPDEGTLVLAVAAVGIHPVADLDEARADVRVAIVAVVRAHLITIPVRVRFVRGDGLIAVIVDSIAGLGSTWMDRRGAIVAVGGSPDVARGLCTGSGGSGPTVAVLVGIQIIGRLDTFVGAAIAVIVGVVTALGRTRVDRGIAVVAVTLAHGPVVTVVVRIGRRGQSQIVEIYVVLLQVAHHDVIGAYPEWVLQ